MELATDLGDAEQHHSEEARREKEGGQHLIGHQRSDDWPGLVGEHLPVCTELVGHDDARHDAHREYDGKDLEPVAIEVRVNPLAGLEPEPFEHGEETRQPDRERREQEVKADRESELHTGKDDSPVLLNHRSKSLIVECIRSEEHTSELQSLMRISYAVFCLKKKQKTNTTTIIILMFD